MFFKNKIYIAIVSVVLSMNSCTLDTEPTDQISENLVYDNISMLDAVLQATYSKLKNETPGHMTQWATCLKLFSTAYGVDINADPNQPYGNTAFLKNASFYMSNSYTPTEYPSRGIWQVLYSIIYNTNVILDHIDNVSGDSKKKDEIKGQALIMRARCYFDLVRIYQHTYIIAKAKPGVPLRLQPKLDEAIPRATVEEVYKQIENDLLQAEDLLVDFQRPNIGYYNIDVARFILANVYLTMNRWEDASKYSEMVRSEYPLMTIEQYKDGFTTMNSEWVLGYAQTTQDSSRDNLSVYYNYNQWTETMSYYALYPADHFVEMMKDDPRGLFMEHPTKPGKYVGTKFYDYRTETPYGDMIDFRSAEMYLVEAEALARQGKTSEALDVLNQLQTARGVECTESSNQSTLLNAILLERRKEMWGEGLDYWDIKRLQKPIHKSISMGHELDLDLPANTNILTLMIPDQEILNNNAMVQNPNPSVEPVFKP